LEEVIVKSFVRFAEYLQELVTKGFVREVQSKDGKRYLTLTDKGGLYVEKYRAIRDFIDEFDL
jgi:predicted transcriptional regulator